MKTHPMRHIPAVTNLVVFDVCARCLSFTRAGQQLGLTQGAVSRQVSELEAYLGQALFSRTQRRLELTPAGQRYATQVRPLLQGLEQATTDLALSLANQSVLRVALSASLCNLWLMPRLPQLLRAHPGLIVNLAPEMGFVDDDRSGADVRIVHRQTEPEESKTSDYLMPINFGAYCAPQLLSGRREVDLEQLMGLPLLHLHEGPGLWQQFLDSANRPDLLAPAGSTNVSFMVNVQLAATGVGVALAPDYLVEVELAAGTLVRAHPHLYRSGRAFYMSYNELRLDWPPLQVFRSWILAQAAGAGVAPAAA